MIQPVKTGIHSSWRYEKFRGCQIRKCGVLVFSFFFRICCCHGNPRVSTKSLRSIRECKLEESLSMLETSVGASLGNPRNIAWPNAYLVVTN